MEEVAILSFTSLGVISIKVYLVGDLEFVIIGIFVVAAMLVVLAAAIIMNTGTISTINHITSTPAYKIDKTLYCLSLSLCSYVVSKFSSTLEAIRVCFLCLSSYVPLS